MAIVEIGDKAAAFRVSAVNREGEAALEDYLGRTALLLGLFRGLHCPFCRRQVVQMNGYRERLRALGVEPLAVVNTEPARGRLYYGRLGLEMTVAADADWVTHRAYGLRRPQVTEGPTQWPDKLNVEEFLAVRVNPDGLLPEAASPLEGNDILNRKDGFELTDVDKCIQGDHGLTGAGYALIDRDGVLRWRWLQGDAGLDELVKFPTERTIFEQAEAL
jgi:peroxiredoxin